MSMFFKTSSNEESDAWDEHFKRVSKQKKYEEGNDLKYLKLLENARKMTATNKKGNK